MKTKASMMKALRARMKADGKVEFRRWVTPETKMKLERVADQESKKCPNA